MRTRSVIQGKTIGRRQWPGMLPLVLTLAATCSTACTLARPESHSDPILIDSHIDAPYRLAQHGSDPKQATDGQFDYERARAGGLDAAFMAIYVPSQYETGGAKRLADSLIDLVESLAKGDPQHYALVTSPSEILSNSARGLISLGMGIENGAAIEHDLDNVEHFYRRGVRYMGLVHSTSNHLADSSLDTRRPWKGLSPLGKEVVRELNRLGIMIDVSHASDEAFYEILSLSKTPVIASHSSARHFVPGFERNMSDEMIQALATHGGVVQVNFASPFLVPASNQWFTRYHVAFQAWSAAQTKRPTLEQQEEFLREYQRRDPPVRASVEDVAQHIDYIAKLVGVDHVGIGSDFDGAGDSMPDGLRDVSEYPNLISSLRRRGYTSDQIQKIAGGNLLRVWRVVEAHGACNCTASAASRRGDRLKVRS